MWNGHTSRSMTKYEKMSTILIINCSVCMKSIVSVPPTMDETLMENAKKCGISCEFMSTTCHQCATKYVKSDVKRIGNGTVIGTMLVNSCPTYIRFTKLFGMYIKIVGGYEHVIEHTDTARYAIPIENRIYATIVKSDGNASLVKYNYTNVKMSENEMQLATAPPNMDDENDRKELLSKGLSGDDDSDDSATTNETSQTNQLRKRNPNKNTARAAKMRMASEKVDNAVHDAQANKPPIPVAGQVQQAGAISNTSKRGFEIEGTNIGSRASEPTWTPEEIEKIADAMRTTLPSMMVPDTRRSQPDPEGKYIKLGKNDSTVTRAPAVLPNIGWNEFRLGLGKVKPDEKTGKNKLYSDVVMKGSDWLLTQWTARYMVLESVPDNILDKPPRMNNGRSERRIGHDFARIGLPKMCFGPIFETLKKIFPSIMDTSSVSQTPGYYWLNASWGVTGSPGKFSYKGAGGVQREEYRLYDVMKQLQGMSSFGVGTIAISIGNESMMQGGKVVADQNKAELSIKLHNFMNIKRVPYHSPPQSAANGFEVSDDIFEEAEILEQNTGTTSTFGATSGAFSGGSANPFSGVHAAVNEGAAPGMNSQGLL
ncbi:hypothetical protein KC359_g8909 [Hortaea werneckii]|nr:hypothetical protein KC359_g8909 [Hortaea werneckii]